MATSTTRRTADQWLALVEQHRESGLSVAEFARREELVYQTFIGWCRKAGKQHPPTHPAPTRSNATIASGTRGINAGALPGFIELGIATARDPRAEDHPEHPERPDRDWLVELELGPGLALRIRRPV